MTLLRLIHYSPTGTTKKILKEISQNLGIKRISEIDIIKKKPASLQLVEEDCLTIIGLPVYSGRLPQQALESLKKFQSDGSPAVVVVVYGNRDFDDALLELTDIIKTCGFSVIAGAAFIGEHSFSTNKKPIGEKRPDQQDLEKCKEFARMISEKTEIFKRTDIIPEPSTIPGNTPYKKRNPLPENIHPETNYELCSQCGICVEACPTNAISLNKSIETNGDLCTWCCACVKICPEEARLFDNPTINGIREKLFQNCTARKEPEFFV